MDQDHPRNPLTQIQRNLDDFGRSLTAGSPESSSWDTARIVMDAHLSQISAEAKRLSLQVREAEHQRQNLLQAALRFLEKSGRSSRSIDELERKMTVWLKAQGVSRIGKHYDDAGLALLKPLLQYQVDHERYGVSEERIRRTGPHVVIHGETIRIVTLLVNELAMNAAKHGALRAEGGFVDILWHTEGTGDAGALVLEWRESCVSEIDPPAERGQGYAGLTSEMPKLYGFEVTEKHEKTGVRYFFRIPRETISPPQNPYVLMVDDDLDIHQMLERVESVPGMVVRYAPSLEQALNILQNGPRPDLALLDRLEGDEAFYVADWLALRGIPFAFITGDAGGEWGRFARELRIQKPFSTADLADKLESIFTSPSARRLK